MNLMAGWYAAVLGKERCKKRKRLMKREDYKETMCKKAWIMWAARGQSPTAKAVP